MVLWWNLNHYVITKTNRFKAALSGASEALFRANYGHDHYQLTWEQELGCLGKTQQLGSVFSPHNDVAKITTPTLWMAAAMIGTYPILNSEQMYLV
jgi:hypothetical protein